MFKLAWVTDIHLDCAYEEAVKNLVEDIHLGESEAVLVTGDIANSGCLVDTLTGLQKKLDLPLYFVLGNHDLWDQRIEVTHGQVKRAMTSDLVWLRHSGVVSLTPDTALVGDDGWYDGRAGDFYTSGFKINDMSCIYDFWGIGKDCELALMQRLADTSTRRIIEASRYAATTHKRVIVATHVPPFVRACRHRGGSTSNDSLPYYCNLNLGNELVDLAYEFPETKFTILAGHTHGQWEYSPVDNLVCRVGGATYMVPEVQGILELT